MSPVFIRMCAPIKNIIKIPLSFMKRQKNECGEYPYFVCDIRCIKYCRVEKDMIKVGSEEEV